MYTYIYIYIYIYTQVYTTNTNTCSYASLGHAIQWQELLSSP